MQRRAEAAEADWMATREVLQAWLDWFGESDRDPAEADGCRPLECDCGFVDLVRRSQEILS
jgi:hypothetical protein